MPFQRFRLDGRIALVTGAAGLLGPEHASALLEAGARVVVTDINEHALVDLSARLTAGHGADRVLALPMDVVKPDSIEAVAAEIVRQWAAPVEVLVNNAAIDAKVSDGPALHEMSRLEHFPLERWNQEVAVGLTGAFLCARAFGSAMAEHRGGVILNISSDLSVFSPDQRLYRKDGLAAAEQPVKPVTYSVIKTALVGLTRYLATYWADRGVRVNALSPGGVRASQPDEFVARLARLVPLARMASRDEYRAAVQFLCSDASSYMTGQNLVMDGGRSVW